MYDQLIITQHHRDLLKKSEMRRLVREARAAERERQDAAEAPVQPRPRRVRRRILRRI